MMYTLDSLYLQLHPALNILRWEWRGALNLPLFQEAFNQLLTYSTRHGITHMLADVRSIPPLGNDEQAWLNEVWLPRTRCLHLKKMAFILPNSLHNQLVVEHFVQAARPHFNAKMQFFSDGPSALDWLTRNPRHAVHLEQEWLGRNSNNQARLVA